MTRMTRGLGRPRSVDLSEEVLRVALRLAYEGGIETATVERIAQQSGVAKTTIYRRWHSASAVVMNAFMQEIAPEIPYVEEKTIALTFRRGVSRFIRALNGQRGRLLRQLIAAAQLDPELRTAFLSNWIVPRREHVRQLIERAVDRGEFKVSVDVEILIDVIFGAVYYRFLMPYANLDRKFASRLARQVFTGILREEQDTEKL